MTQTIAGVPVALLHADITELDVDAVVVPQFANSVSWGGVGHAVAKAGALGGMFEYGKLVQECGRMPFGSAHACEAGGGRARWLVHVVSVACDDECDDADMVRQCVSNALAEVARVGARSVAFPALGTGIIGTLTLDASARAIASGVNDHAASGLPIPDVAVAIHDDPEALRAFEAAFANWTGPDRPPGAMGDLDVIGMDEARPAAPARPRGLPAVRAAVASLAGRLRLTGPGFPGA